MKYPLLIVAHDYPPLISARAIRWRALAEHWAQQGHQVDVVSAWQTGFTQTEVIHGVQVHRVNAMWLENLRAWFKKARALSDEHNNGKSKENPQTQTRNAVAQMGHWLYQQIYKQLYWPDSAFPWCQPAFAQAKELLSRRQYDVLISVSPYFTAHLVGMRVHKLFPRLPWLVDIGDPFSYLEFETPNNRRLYKAFNYHKEQRVFQKADMICVTTQETRNRYADIFPDCTAKIHVVPPLISFSSSEIEQPDFFPSDSAIRLVYLGRLYADVRRPDFLLQLFDALLQTSIVNPLELHFFGDTRDVSDSFEHYNQLIGSNIFRHDPVDHKTAIRIMQDASLLVNIGNKSSYQLPSKVVEYACTGKPILNLSQIEEDSSCAFFRGYPSVLNLLDSEKANFEQQVNDLAQMIMHLPSRIDQEDLHTFLSAFQIGAVSASYENIISQSIQDKKHP